MQRPATKGTRDDRKSPPVNGTFHARLREGGGLYRAEYSGEINPQDTDEWEILDFQLGASATGVKSRVDEMARGLGYTEVVRDAT